MPIYAHVPGANAANAAGNLTSGPVPSEPALSAAAEAIFRQVSYAQEAAHRIGAALDRLMPPVPAEFGPQPKDAQDSTLLSVMAAVENRAAMLAHRLGEMAAQLDRAI